MSRILTFVCLLISLPFLAQNTYQADVLGEQFVQKTFHQNPDYEGEVVSTLVKYDSGLTTGKAILYIHGFNDYFFQTEMAKVFAKNGIRFYALDLRKYGRSHLAHQSWFNVRDLHEYFPDIDSALHQMKLEGCSDIILSGHSTGGLITTLYASEYPRANTFHALFVNSPFYDFNLPPFLEKHFLPKIAAKGAKKPNKTMKAKLSNWYGHSLHKSEKGEWDYNLSWKGHIPPKVNFGWIHAIQEAQQTIQAGVTIDVPVLVMHSNQSVMTKKWDEKYRVADGVLDVDDIAKYARMIKGDIRIVSVTDGMHDLVLSKKEVREQVYEVIFGWISEDLPR